MNGFYTMNVVTLFIQNKGSCKPGLAVRFGGLVKQHPVKAQFGDGF